MNKKIISYTHAVFTVILALFFFYAGVQKFIPKPPRPIDKTAVVSAIENDYLESPVSFMLTMRSMKQSGFLYVIGVFQILAALLMLIPKTRLSGLLLLLPIITNIFMLHFFMDNRLHENVETGILLTLTALLSAYYYKTILQVF